MKDVSSVQPSGGQKEVVRWVFSPDPEVEKAVADVLDARAYIGTHDLSRIKVLLEKLGNPHLQKPFTFHVAGTNGKGSTLSFLQSIFEEAGLIVHRFTSPHLIRFEERIILNGKNIAPDILLGLIKECRELLKDEEFSFFEFFTALSFLAYSRYPADILLLETGVGGGNDPTNMIEGEDIVSILTSVSYDHQQVLGETLEEIASQKSGIMKPGCPCVVAPQRYSEVRHVFENRAKEKESSFYQEGRDWTVHLKEDGFDYKSPSFSFSLPFPALQGAHQIENAATAIKAIEVSPYAHLLTEPLLQKAMKNVKWAGRLQNINEGPLANLLPKDWELWFDAAHNEEGAQILLEELKKGEKDKPIHMITARKKEKGIVEFYQKFLPFVTSIKVVDLNWIAPTVEGAFLSKALKDIGYLDVQEIYNIENAIRDLTLQFSSPQRIVVTGSLYLLGYALRE